MGKRLWCAVVVVCSLSSFAHAEAPRGRANEVAEASSDQGVKANLDVAPLEANRLRDVIVRFEQPIYFDSAILRVGRPVYHDDGRESYVEVEGAVPFAFVRDADGRTQEILIQAGGAMGDPSSFRSLELIFSTEVIKDGVRKNANVQSLTFSLEPQMF